MLWSTNCLLWSIICVIAAAETSHSSKQCCFDNIIPKEGQTCNNGSKIDMDCADSSYLILHENKDYEVKNGVLVIIHPFLDIQYAVPSKEYCTGILTDTDGNGFNVALLCLLSKSEHEHDYLEERLYLKIYSYFLLVSVLFLLATFIVYCSLPSLRDLHGMCLMSFVGCLAVGYFSLAVLQQNFFNYDVSQSTCTTFGFWTYFWLLSAFFWLSIISFNIWYQSRFATAQTLKDHTLWIIYLMFGFGIPMLFLIIATMSHNFPSRFLIEPNIGNGVCWFQGMLETWIYFSGPMAILLSCNLIFFVLTIRVLWMHYKDTRPQPRIRTLRFKAALYLKLFLTMGLTWIFELISFTFQIDWYVSDILNSLQGPIIFTLMVLNRAKVMRSLSCTNTFYTVFFLCTKPWNEKDDEDENETQVLDNIQMTDNHL